MFQVQQALSHDTSVAWVKHTEAPERSTEITNTRIVLNWRIVQYRCSSIATWIWKKSVIVDYKVFASPEEVAWRFVWKPSSTNPMPVSDLLHFLIVDTFCTIPGLPSDRDHMPVRTQQNYIITNNWMKSRLTWTDKTHAQTNEWAPSDRKQLTQ